MSGLRDDRGSAPTELVLITPLLLLLLLWYLHSQQ